MTITGNFWIFLITGTALVCYVAVGAAVIRSWRRTRSARARSARARSPEPAPAPAPRADLDGTQLLVNPLGTAWLEVTVDGKSRVLPLSARQTIVGSRAPSDVQVDDRFVSGKHLGVTLHPDGRVSIVDLDSTNGTFVNGVRVERAFVGAEDEVRIGKTTLRIVPAEKPSAAHSAA